MVAVVWGAYLAYIVNAYGATSIVVCNYFVLGVKAYGATSILECKQFRLGREGLRGHFNRGVQADSTDLLREKALAQLGPSARMCSPGSDCTVFWQCVVSSAQTRRVQRGRSGYALIVTQQDSHHIM